MIVNSIIFLVLKSLFVHFDINKTIKNIKKKLSYAFLNSLSFYLN